MGHLPSGPDEVITSSQPSIYLFLGYVDNMEETRGDLFCFIMVFS